jgi:hypothetical protein
MFNQKGGSAQISFLTVPRDLILMFFTIILFSTEKINLPGRYFSSAFSLWYCRISNLRVQLIREVSEKKFFDVKRESLKFRKIESC